MPRVNRQEFLKKIRKLSADQQYNRGCLLLAPPHNEDKLRSAIEYLTLAAQKNHAPSLYQLDLIYDSDTYALYVNQDKDKASSYLLRAVRQGYQPAIDKLNEKLGKNPFDTLVQQAKDLMKNPGHLSLNQAQRNAIDLFKYGADQGDAASAYELGVMYVNGWGGPKLPQHAKQLFELAAKKNHAPAHFMLAVMLAAENWGVDPDPAKANEHLHIAVKLEYAPALYTVGKKLADRQDASPDDLQKAVDLLQAAVNQNYAPAQFYLGMMYAQGRGVDRDDIEAVRHLAAAAKQGHAAAQYFMGERYAYGNGVPQNKGKAALLFAKAHKQNHVQASYRLGVLYTEDPDLQEYVQTQTQTQTRTDALPSARQLFKHAAAQNFAPAQYALGLYYRYNSPPDEAKAIAQLDEAARQGLRKAQLELILPKASTKEELEARSKLYMLEEAYEEMNAWKQPQPNPPFDRALRILSQKLTELEGRPDFKSNTTAAGAVSTLIENLKQEQRVLFYANPARPDLDLFKTNCKRRIDRAREVLDEHRGWKKIAANVLAIVLTAVVGYALAAVYNVTKRGKFTFFATDSSMKLDKAEGLIDESVKNPVHR